MLAILVAGFLLAGGLCAERAQAGAAGAGTRPAPVTAEAGRVAQPGTCVAWARDPYGARPLSIDREEKPARQSARERRRAAQERRAARDEGEYQVEHEGRLQYDRVNGLLIWNGISGSGGGNFLPEIQAGTGYAFGRKYWYYEGSVLQPVVPGRYLLLGGRAYLLSAPRAFDEEIVGEPENSLAAAFFKEDFRDYYETRGHEALLESRLGSQHTLRAGYRREEVESMGVIADWSLFRRDREFRENPPVNEGRLHALSASYTFDTRDRGRRTGAGFSSRSVSDRIDRARRARRAGGSRRSEMSGLGLYWRLTAERAGRGGLGGDFQYDRAAADLRQYTKLGPRISLQVRLAGGWLETASDGASLYPAHKEFYVGGISTLPGYRHKAFRGDRMVLANVEYGVGDEPKILVLADAGDAWVQGARDPEVHADVGLGFQAAEDALRVMVCERLDEAKASPVWWVRLQRSF